MNTRTGIVLAALALGTANASWGHGAAMLELELLGGGFAGAALRRLARRLAASSLRDVRRRYRA